MDTFDQSFSNLFEDVEKRLPSSGNAEVGLDSKERANVLEQLNGLLTPLTHTPVLNVYYMIQRIKDRLATTTGLTFSDALFAGEGGQKNFRLVPVDGVYAHTFSGVRVPVNGWLSLFPHGLDIHFRYVKLGNLYTVHAEIQPVVNSSPVPVTEKKEQ
jgi:hypothetical protein